MVGRGEHLTWNSRVTLTRAPQVSPKSKKEATKKARGRVKPPSWTIKGYETVGAGSTPELISVCRRSFFDSIHPSLELRFLKTWICGGHIVSLTSSRLSKISTSMATPG